VPFGFPGLVPALQNEVQQLAANVDRTSTVGESSPLPKLLEAEDHTEHAASTVLCTAEEATEYQTGVAECFLAVPLLMKEETFPIEQIP
jgi:hypothetical protein